jgi:hypothetical protein
MIPMSDRFVDAIGLTLVAAGDTPVPGYDRTTVHTYWAPEMIEDRFQSSLLVNFPCWRHMGSADWVRALPFVGRKLSGVETFSSASGPGVDVRLFFGTADSFVLRRYVMYPPYAVS